MTETPQTMRTFELFGHGNFDQLCFHEDGPILGPDLRIFYLCDLTFIAWQHTGKIVLTAE